WGRVWTGIASVPQTLRSSAVLLFGRLQRMPSVSSSPALVSLFRLSFRPSNLASTHFGSCCEILIDVLKRILPTMWLSSEVVSNAIINLLQPASLFDP